MMTPVTSRFIARLRANDQAAWFELWETFGPVVSAQLTKWGKGRIGAQTVQDLSQDTLAALSDSIDRFDPARGVRFSTWLLSIAKHCLSDELDRRGALKRGGAVKPEEFHDDRISNSGAAEPDELYERAMFGAKIEAAIRLAERECDFADFAVFSMRVLEGKSGKDVAAALGTSEPTVTRRLARVRDVLRAKLREVIEIYSFTEDERNEAINAGVSLDASSKSEQDAAFDDAVGEIFRLHLERRRNDADD